MFEKDVNKISFRMNQNFNANDPINRAKIKGLIKRYDLTGQAKMGPNGSTHLEFHHEDPNKLNEFKKHFISAIPDSRKMMMPGSGKIGTSQKTPFSRFQWHEMPKKDTIAKPAIKTQEVSKFGQDLQGQANIKPEHDPRLFNQVAKPGAGTNINAGSKPGLDLPQGNNLNTGKINEEISNLPDMDI